MVVQRGLIRFTPVEYADGGKNVCGLRDSIVTLSGMMNAILSLERQCQPSLMEQGRGEYLWMGLSGWISVSFESVHHFPLKN